MSVTHDLAEAKGNQNMEFVIVELSADLRDWSVTDPVTAVSLSCCDNVCEPLRFKIRFN